MGVSASRLGTGHFSHGLLGEHMNIEEFTEDRMKLLSFLHVRSAYASHEWAMFDAAETRFYFLSPQIPIHFNEKCVIMCGEDFGRLVDPDIGLVHYGAVLGYPRACATLHAQLFIAGGLRNIVDAIVAGAPPSGDHKWAELVSSGLHSSAIGARWSAYETRLFAPPLKFEPNVLLEMARDQLNRVVDEFELLQTPQYLRDYALNIKAHISWDTSVSSASKWGYVAGVVHELWIQRM